MADIIPLGQRLRERREERGISQAQAARELDVARTAYRLWELEAARPSSDRWRAISRWLGISVAALLLSEDLTGVGEAEDVERITKRLLAQGTDWDESSARETGDYFSQERSTIQEQAALGSISTEESGRLTEMLEKIATVAGDEITSTWRTAEFRKDLIAGPNTADEARAALTVTASGVPTGTMEAADELVTALIDDSVASTSGTISIIAFHIEVGRRTLRVEASDRLVPGDGREGPGWDFVMNQASRWGATGRNGARVRWFELDLPEPGRTPR